MGNPTRSQAGLSTATKNSTLWSMPAPDPTKLIWYFNDFVTYAAGDFTVTETGFGSRARTAGNGGLLLITNAAVDNDTNQFQVPVEIFVPVAGKKMWFKSRFKVSDATQSDVFMGLALVDTTLQGSVSGDGVTDGIFFNKDDGDALIDFQVQKDATTGQNRAVGLATLVDDTFVTLGFEYDGASAVKYFVDDVHIGTLDASSTYFPDGAGVTPSWAIQNGEGVAKTMTLDYVFAAQER